MEYIVLKNILSGLVKIVQTFSGDFFFYVKLLLMLMLCINSPPRLSSGQDGVDNFSKLLSLTTKTTQHGNK